MQTEKPSVRRHILPRATRDHIVLENLSLVRAIAVHVHDSLPVHVDLDDLVHAGILGLFDAAEKYDEGKQVAFQAYAKHRIKGAILDSLRELDWASRDMRKRHKKVEAAVRDLSSKLGRTPAEWEVADSLGMGLERWRRMMLELRTVGLLSASGRGDTDGAPAPEFPAEPDTQPDRVCAHTELKHAVQRALGQLPERYRRVMSLYYTGELTMKEIGEALGVNESRISQIHKSALEKMAAALHSEGIHSSRAFC
ncbi:MAG: sigma-70 family RNA polymerase sigma factor [Bryobacteraceae bacterium]